MYKRVYPLGFVYDDKKWRRTAWDFKLGIPLKKLKPYHEVRPYLFGTYLRIVEWPWSKDLRLQGYYKNKKVFDLNRWTGK